VCLGREIDPGKKIRAAIVPSSGADAKPWLSSGALNGGEDAGTTIDPMLVASAMGVELEPPATPDG
jgi:hypothetical protein